MTTDPRTAPPPADPDTAAPDTAAPDAPPDDEEPTVLGAAPTVRLDRSGRRRRRREQRQQRRLSGSDPTTIAAVDRTPAPVDDPYDGPEYVYAAGRAFIAPLREYAGSLWHRRAFIAELARSELKGKRQSTLLGGLWAVLDPLFQAIIFYFLFTVIRKGGRPIEFLHTIVYCVFLFQLVSGALTQGGNSIRSGANLMLNSTFPRALLPLSAVYQSVLRLGPAMVVYLGFHIALDAPIHWGLLLLAPLVVILIVMSVGLAFITSTLVVFFRDASNAMGYVGRVFFITTPIIYPYTLLSDRIRDVLRWQPTFHIFESFQKILAGTNPHPHQFFAAAGFAVTLLVIGSWLFRRNEHKFASRL